MKICTEAEFRNTRNLHDMDIIQNSVRYFEVRCYVKRIHLFAELNISGRYIAVVNMCKYSKK